MSLNLDRVRDCNFLGLNFETETKTGFIRVSISRPSPRLKLSESQPQDRVRDHRNGRDRDRESRYTLPHTCKMLDLHSDYIYDMERNKEGLKRVSQLKLCHHHMLFLFLSLD